MPRRAAFAVMAAWTRLVIVAVALLFLGGCAFFRASYAPNSSLADYEERMSRYAEIAEEEDWIRITPDGTATPTTRTGVIFYPGGKVSPRAYIPLFDRIVREGYPVYIAKMPLDLAVMDIDRAMAIIEDTEAPQDSSEQARIETWHIAGHSLGGAMAAQLVEREPGTFAGLTLLASFPGGRVDLSDQEVDVLSIYGTRDGVANPEEIRNAAEQYPADARFLAISGGNHAQFGVYGPQEDDGAATISGEEQRRVTQEAMLELIRG
jgi:dienelactone hydrolase